MKNPFCRISGADPEEVCLPQSLAGVTMLARQETR